MALRATTYKVHLGLSDTDRGVYESVRGTVARHPSETEERLTARILAYGLYYEERLEFGRGLSEVDEPAMWRKSLDGVIEHWIDVGRPDSDRLIWCSRRAEKVSLLAYGNTLLWQAQVLPRVAGLKNLNIAVLPQEPMDALAVDLPRAIDWGLMITDDVLYISDADMQHEIKLEWLQGGR
ncbi:MAG: YaeQ family protein [Wenzhouxiangellaceae bacterium]|nr:YaeQ family protein [Wenzhouxiangellaceae bacterium]